jgi:polysaccharide export outer membrane protein
LPQYRIEPPDVLSIVGTHIVPRASYRLRTTDEISVAVLGTLPDNPITGLFPIVPGGSVELGGGYGTVIVAGKTVNEARQAIQEHLSKFLRDPQVTVSLARTGSAEQILGEHLVGPDGRITLGTFGSVVVVGLTKAEAKQVIERHLSLYFEEPEVAVDVLGYNSKVYYVITQGAGLGDNVFSFPSTGNETVLDAIVQINGLTAVSSKQIWVARPGLNSDGCDQILPVDWQSVTERGNVATNYQILPGDRVYVAQDEWVAFDTYLAKIITPFERLMGFTLLGTETVTRLSGPVLRGGGNPNGFGRGGGQ